MSWVPTPKEILIRKYISINVLCEIIRKISTESNLENCNMLKYCLEPPAYPLFNKSVVFFSSILLLAFIIFSWIVLWAYLPFRISVLHICRLPPSLYLPLAYTHRNPTHRQISSAASCVHFEHIRFRECKWGACKDFPIIKQEHI